MKKNLSVICCFAMWIVGLCNAQAQTGPIDGATFEIDPATGLQNITSLTVTRQGVTEVFALSALIGIDVIDVSTSFPPQGGPALVGVPSVDPAGTPAGEITASLPAERATLLEDFAINTVINNAGNAEGIVFSFTNGGIVNGPGIDLVLFELSPPPGVPPTGGQLTPGLAVGGDPFTLQGTGDQIGFVAGFGPEFYGPLDDTAVDSVTFFGSGDLGAAASNVSGIDEFEAISVAPLTVLAESFFLLQASGVDLSDMGFADGELVSELELLSNPVVVSNASGALSGPFGVDVSLIVGLPLAPPALCGDIDLSGMVDFLDISPFIGLLATGAFQAQADCDLDGTVTFLDISPFIEALTGP